MPATFQVVPGNKSGFCLAAPKIRTGVPGGPIAAGGPGVEQGTRCDDLMNGLTFLCAPVITGDERGRQTDQGRRGAQQAAGASVPCGAGPSTGPRAH